MSINQTISCFVENYDKWLTKITDIPFLERIALVVLPIFLTCSVAKLEYDLRYLGFDWLSPLTFVLGVYATIFFIANSVGIQVLKGGTAENYICCLQTRLKLSSSQIFDKIKENLDSYHQTLEQNFKLLNGFNVAHIAVGAIGLTLVLMFIADRRVSMKTIFFLNMISLGTLFLGNHALSNLRSPPNFKALQDDLAKCF